MRKKIIVVVLSLLFVLIFVSSISAITGRIGNARMILRVESGEQIEKYILVKNVNEVYIDVELFASGDLVEDIDIKDKKFSLFPGETKKAYFVIDVKEEGTTESRMNVQFTPEEGNGVGLSSTIIVIAKGAWDDEIEEDEIEVDEIEEVDDDEDDNDGGSSSNRDNDDDEDEEDEEGGMEESEIEEDEEGLIGSITGMVIGENSDSKNGKIKVAFVITGFVLLGFMISLLALSKKTKERIELGEESEEKMKDIVEGTENLKKKPKKRKK